MAVWALSGLWLAASATSQAEVSRARLDDALADFKEKAEPLAAQLGAGAGRAELLAQLQGVPNLRRQSFLQGRDDNQCKSDDDCTRFPGSLMGQACIADNKDGKVCGCVADESCAVRTRADGFERACDDYLGLGFQTCGPQPTDEQAAQHAKLGEVQTRPAANAPSSAPSHKGHIKPAPDASERSNARGRHESVFANKEGNPVAGEEAPGRPGHPDAATKAKGKPAATKEKGAKHHKASHKDDPPPPAEVDKNAEDPDLPPEHPGHQHKRARHLDRKMFNPDA